MTSRSRRAGFTLIELVVVIAALAIAVPPTLMWMNDAAIDRADAVQASRATALASSVLETILADVSSRDASLGFAALSDAPAYLDTPATGLRDRLRPISDGFDAHGLAYTVSIGPARDRAGAVNARDELNLFRTVSVTVTFPRGRGGTASVELTTVVSDL